MGENLNPFGPPCKPQLEAYPGKQRAPPLPAGLLDGRAGNAYFAGALEDEDEDESLFSLLLSPLFL
jgi:hypothetical protein